MLFLCLKEGDKLAKETKIGNLVIDLQIKTAALESGLNTAKKKLQEIEQANKQVENSNNSIDSSWIAIAGTATAALLGIKSAVSSCIKEYNQYVQSMESLQNVSDYTNQSMTDMANIMNKYSSIMNKSDIATTIKNFSLMGFTVEETDKMIEALTNSAIRNRNANYTVSEAVRVASEGYRQGLSTLSDSAGVTENLSVMLDKYAKSIGKTASQLTVAEQNQAYLNRTMYAAEPFAGAMEGYLDSLAGKQGLFSQSMRDTQVAYSEAIEPVFSGLLTTGTQILELLNNLISANPNLTAGFTSFAVTLAALVLVFSTVKKGIDLYTSSTFGATVATNGLTAAIAANPLGALAVVISLVVGAVVSLTNAEKELTEAQEELSAQTERYNQIKEGTYEYTDDAISQAEQDKVAIEEQISSIQKYIEAKEKLEQLKAAENTYSYKNGYTLDDGTVLSGDEFSKQYNETEDVIKSLDKEMRNYGSTLDDIKNKEQELIQQQEAYQKVIEDSNTIKELENALDIDTLKSKQEEAAQLKVNASTMQKYLDVYKKGETNTTEYQTALKTLAEAYPEAATANGLLIDAIQGQIDAESLSATYAWQSAQEQINAQIAILQAALSSEEVQRQVAENLGIKQDELNAKLSSTLALYQTMAGYNPEEVPNITPTAITAPTVSTPSVSSGSSSYSNDALDNYKKEIEHKKALDQITLKEEIQMYEYALSAYANTADEKMELREQIYDLNKELAQKEKDILDQQTEDYENYIEDQKNMRGAAYDVVEQTKDYDKIIDMHKRYLDQIMYDERLSLEERKEIYREELQTIRDYEQQKRDLRVEAVDNTVSQLADAITKQLEEMQDKEKEAIDKNLEEVEKWKDARIEAINEEYDARIEAINKELEALDKAEEQKSRDEEDAEYERKKLRLEQLIAYEHDATTRANYQKELDELIADYQKTLDERALQDKKDALNEQKELLQQEQDDKVQAIEEEAEKQKEVYEQQLEDLENYYEQQIDMAQETAEKMLLNVEENQDKILQLLQSYGDKYEITGQSLGEKLAQGINNGLSNKIQNLIQKVQDTIDTNLNNKIKEWTASNYKYEEGAGKPVTQNITVNQTNNIEQNPELPSETYRKLNNISQNLAAELAGM